MKLQITTLIGLFILSSVGLRAQVTIGSGAKPNQAAILDLKTQETANPTSVTDDSNVTSTTGGLLLPRVKLISLTSLEPFIVNASATDKIKHAGLLVHNLNATSMLKHGTYQWDGVQWRLLAADVAEAEWKYDGTADAERVYLARNFNKGGNFYSNVFIRKDGSMVNTDGDHAASENVYLSATRAASGIKKTAAADNSISMQRNYLHIDTDLYKTFIGTRSRIGLPGDNKVTTDATMISFLSELHSFSDNPVTEMAGYKTSILKSGSGSATIVAGGLFDVIQSGSGATNMLIGALPQIGIGETASAAEAFGVRTWASFQPGHRGKVNNVQLISAKSAFHSSDTEIDNITGLNIDLLDNHTVRPLVGKAHGIFVHDVAIGATDNYAIYTNRGTNRLGDVLNIHTVSATLDPNAAVYPLRLHNDANYVGNQITGIEFWNASSRKGVPTARILSEMHRGEEGGENLHFQTQSGIESGTNRTLPTTKMTILADGNVGIGITSPSAKLEINTGGTSVAPIVKGFRLEDGNQLAGRVLTSDGLGYATWAAPSASSFYMPPFNLSLHAGVGNAASVNLYDVYNQHYTAQSGKFVSSDPAIGSVPNVYPREKLAFLVLDYDQSVITVNSIDANATMHYTVNSIAPSATSYISIICVVKE